MAKERNDLKIWKLLTDFWGLLAILFFMLTFFKIIDLKPILTDVAVVYISVLSIFTGVKEFNRWKAKEFISRHNGEIFIIMWTFLTFLFMMLTVWNPSQFDMATEFTATYLSILGIYAISRESKHLRK